MTGDSGRAAWLRHARSYLRNADPVLARLIDERPEFDPRAWMTQLPPMDLYGALLFQVTGQQLSVAATRRTLARIEALFGDHLPAPAELLAVNPGQLREAGLSWRKVATLRDLAERMSDGRLDPDVLGALPDDELLAQLTAISGIGPWTVQGALLIALGREDVVLPGDLALRKAIQAAYRLGHLPTQREVLDIADKWRPYRSLATSYLFSAAFELAGAPPAARQAALPAETTSRKKDQGTISDDTVAIIGIGNLGSTLAANFAAGGQDFLVAGRDQQAARKLASSLDGHAEAVSIDEAVERADVLVFAVWLDAFRELIARYGERLAGKVIVDPSNPVGPDGAGGYHKVIGEQESSGQILAGLLPAGARLVKAFGTLSAPTLSAAAWREPECAVQFYAADDDAAGDLVAELIRADGYEPVRVGGLDQSIRIEMFGDLHEYGALGRAVTKSEALAAV